MGKKVLIADDEKEIVSILEAALVREGFEVIAAFDGQEAKAKILEHRPDVILLDLIMPGLDGWEVLQWLRKEEKLVTPTIIISAKDQMKEIKKSYALDADYYIIKPIRIKDLIKAIHTVSSLKTLDRNEEG